MVKSQEIFLSLICGNHVYFFIGFKILCFIRLREEKEMLSTKMDMGEKANILKTQMEQENKKLRNELLQVENEIKQKTMFVKKIKLHSQV